MDALELDRVIFAGAGAVLARDSWAANELWVRPSRRSADEDLEKGD
jgi:hypothetical protein